MMLNLPILALDVIDSLSYQKCLIPKHKFPENARPGQWAKCYFIELSSEKQYYAVAQIFPREDLNEACYLDTCVTNYADEEDQQLILEKFGVLKNNKEIKTASVTLQLNPEYFIENSSLFNKSYLQELAKTLLQKYHLTHCSSIRDKYLLDNGIDSIRFEIDEDCDASTHLITDKSHIIIKNITLTYKEFSRDLISFDAKPFAQAREELENLIKFVRLQRFSQKRSLCMNLNAILVGAVGCGKTSLVEDILRRQHCNVFPVKITSCLKQYPGETEAELRKIFKAACDFENKFKATDPTVILIEEIHLLFPHTTSTVGNNVEALANHMRICAQFLSLVDGLLTSRTNIMCLATTSKLECLNELIRRPGRFENQISIPSLQEHIRMEILMQLLRQSMPNFDYEIELLKKIVKQTHGYVLADLVLLVRLVTQASLTTPEDKLEDKIYDILKKSTPTSLKGVDVSVFKTTETFESMAGMKELKKELEISVLAGLNNPELYRRFGLSLPKGILLFGPPGCGKTTIAKCLATEASMNFIATSSAEVYSPYVGCAEKFIANIFQTAHNNSPCLIFLDEIDSLVGHRSLAGSSNSNDVQTRVLSTLLTEMDGVISPFGQDTQIVVVAATNRPDLIDDALLRPGRFDKLIHVEVPDILSRLQILNLYGRKMPFARDLDYDSIICRTKNYSCADVCNLCNEAAIQAFQRDLNANEIITEDFENVLNASNNSVYEPHILSYYRFKNNLGSPRVVLGKSTDLE